MSPNYIVLRSAAYSSLVAVEEYDSAGKSGHDLTRTCLIPIPRTPYISVCCSPFAGPLATLRCPASYADQRRPPVAAFARYRPRGARLWSASRTSPDVAASLRYATHVSRGWPRGLTHALDGYHGGRRECAAHARGASTFLAAGPLHGSVADRRRVRRERNTTEDSVRLIGKTRRVEECGHGLVSIAVSECE